MDELKPCPFCGGEASMNLTLRAPFVLCSSCQSSTPPLTTLDAAIAAWNRRAALASEPAQPTYREVGVWEPDGRKFMTYRRENLNGKAMFVLDASSVASKEEPAE